MRTDDLDFQLPPELIAQSPSPDRAGSRLLHYRRADRSIAHRLFSDLPLILSARDQLVFNDAKVMPARFGLRKISGGHVEGLFLTEPSPGRWRALLKNAGSSREFVFEDDPSIRCNVVGRGADGEYELQISSDESARVILSRLGRMPLPPYIRREKSHDERDVEDRARYQTVYAKSEGSIAAPTAGLHFTTELLSELRARGVDQTSVTLDVGMGTFKPVTTPTLDEHEMHIETYAIGPATASALNAAKAEAKRIIAVGTTSARVLESQLMDEAFVEKRDQTALLIQPPYQWKHVGGLITNFHLPRSTLIALVAAMVGIDEQRRIYQIAIEQRYRFFSFGDAMLIE